MNNKVISVIVILILAVGAFLLFKNQSLAPLEEGIIENNMPVPGSEVEEREVITEGSEAVIKEFVVNLDNFSFSPNTMRVNVGDTVRITVKNINGYHDLKIDEFNVATRILNAGQEEVITFVANRTGTFEYYCSVGSHRQMGMVGTLIVN
jgi:plastocyanin